MLSKDAYCLGLLYAYMYSDKKMVLKDDLDRFHDIIEYNLKTMNSKTLNKSTTTCNDDESPLYFLSEGKNGEIYYVLYPGFDLSGAKMKYIDCLSTDIIIASQRENALNSIDLKKVNGNIVRKKPNELRLPNTSYLKEAKVCEITHG